MSAPTQAGPAADAAPRRGDSVTATYQARQLLARAHWAAGAFASYDRGTVLAIACFMLGGFVAGRLYRRLPDDRLRELGRGTAVQ